MAIGRAKAPAESTSPPACDACKSTTEPLQIARTDASVRVCIAQTPCIARAKTAGIWLAS